MDFKARRVVPESYRLELGHRRLFVFMRRDTVLRVPALKFLYVKSGTDKSMPPVINFTRLFSAFNEIHGYLAYSANIRQSCIVPQAFAIGGKPLFYYQIGPRAYFYR